MEVYGINDLIDWLHELQEVKGLSYVSDGEIVTKLNEIKQIPKTRPEVSKQVKLLTKHVKIGEIIDKKIDTLNLVLNRERFTNKFRSIKDFGDVLQLDRSTLHRWRKSGVIAGDRKDLLLLHLEELNEGNKLLQDLEMAVSHVNRITTKENEHRTINSTNCMKYIGIDSPTYKKWRRKEYIRGVMLSEIARDLAVTIQWLTKT